MFYIFFYWRIIALQCCTTFGCSMKWISYMSTYIPSLLDLSPSTPPPFHPSGSSENTKLSSLCCTAASHSLSILHTAVYICRSISPNSSHSLFPLLCPHVHSLCLCLYPCVLQTGSSVAKCLNTWKDIWHSQTINAGESVMKRERSYTVGGNAN